MVYGVQDAIMLRQLADASDGDAAYKRIGYQKIQSMLGYCEVTGCRRQSLLRYFGEPLEEPCGNCDTCLEPVTTWDATVAAQKALSCIYRTQQRFGVGHLIDVLLGRETERMRSLRHDQVSTFGIGGEHSERVWRSVFRQLIARGLVRVDDYGSLQLLPAAKPVMKGEERLELRHETESASTGRRRRRKARSGATADKAKARRSERTELEERLFAALSRYRMQLAKAADLPPYCIFHNSTLDEMVAAKPTTLAELRSVSGVGDAKLAKYGAGFLDTLRAVLDPQADRLHA
jgi:ATP-dependent DNA helicase RecQ